MSQKPWLNNYLAGIPAEITINEDTLIDMFLKAATDYPDNKAVTCMGKTLTFTELKNKAEAVAQSLLIMGVKKGDRIAIILPNSIQYPVIILATLYLGAVIVNINPLYTPSEIEFVINDSTPSVVFCLDILADKLADIEIKSVRNVITTNIADPLSGFKRSAIKFVQKYVQKKLKPLNYQSTDFRELYFSQFQISAPIKINADDLAIIQYTGATTGRPKGAMLSHKNIGSNVRQVWAFIDPQMQDLDKDIVMCVLPLYHIFSLNANLLSFLFRGAENVMIPNPKDIKSLVKTMNQTPFTIFNSLDTLYNKLLQTPEFTEAKHPSYKHGICGGMTTRHSVAAKWEQVTGITPANCYGLSESSPCATMSYFKDPYTGSAGTPIPSTEIEIRHQVNLYEELPIGENGVIFIRGPQVMQGYWNNPEQTAKVLDKDGWLNTGDIGYIDERGYLFITNRMTEMILVSGFNVYPAEIERVISELLDVNEVSVLGHKDENSSSEKIHAFVVPQANSHITTKLIKDYCQKHLTRYKIPNYIHIIESMPKTEVGKTDKKALVKSLSEN